MSNPVVFKGDYPTLIKHIEEYFESKPLLSKGAFTELSCGQLGEDRYRLIYTCAFTTQMILVYGIINESHSEGSVIISSTVNPVEITETFAWLVQTLFRDSSKKYQRSICLDFGEHFSDVLYETMGKENSSVTTEEIDLNLSIDQIIVLKDVELIEEFLGIEIA